METLQLLKYGLKIKMLSKKDAVIVYLGKLNNLVLEVKLYNSDAVHLL